MLPFYVPKPKSELFDIWARQKALASEANDKQDMVAEDERVEDAGLEQDLENLTSDTKSKESDHRTRAVA